MYIYIHHVKYLGSSFHLTFPAAAEVLGAPGASGISRSLSNRNRLVVGNPMVGKWLDSWVNVNITNQLVNVG